MKRDIRRLAPALLRLITERLDFEDLVRLYGTFDFGIQKQLAFPGVVDVVQLTDSNPSGAVKLLLLALRNVRRVEVSKSVDNFRSQLPLILALNPLELSFERGKQRQPPAEVHITTFKSLSDPPVGQTASLNPIELHRYAPRLTHLEVRLEHTEYYFRPFSSIFTSYPTTLTSFKLENKDYDAKLSLVLSELPSTLRSLSLLNNDHLINFEVIQSTFPLLEHLEVAGAARDLRKKIIFHNSLSHLTLYTELGAAIRLLHKSNFQSISKLELLVNEEYEGRPSTIVDFGSLLPPTTTEITLGKNPYTNHKYERFPNVHILSFPPNLTSLTCTFDKVYPSFVGACNRLPQLQTLHLYSLKAPIILGSGDFHQIPLRILGTWDLCYLDSMRLPRSLTSLLLDASYFSLDPAAIFHLPSNLTSLSLPSFRLSLRSSLRKRLSKCFLRILLPIDLWDAENGNLLRSKKFGGEWQPSFCLTAWASRVLRKAASRWVELTSLPTSSSLELPALPTQLRTHEVEAEVKQCTADFSNPFVARLINCESLSISKFLLGLPQLESLHLTIPPTLKNGRLKFRDLPSSLTDLTLLGRHFEFCLPKERTESRLWRIITTTQHCLCFSPVQLPKSLKFLDAPNWDFNSTLVSHWSFRRFKKLCISVTGLKDWEVASFVTDLRCDAYTRLNTQLIVSFHLTGLMMPPKDALYVTWDIIAKTTEDEIDKLLQAPVLLDASVASIPPNKFTLRSGIMKWEASYPQHYLEFPISSQVIRLDNSDQYWELGPSNPKRLPRSHPLLESLERLVHLELDKVRWNRSSSFFDLLPPTLLFLRFSTDESFQNLGQLPPPNLEVLMIDCTPRREIEGFPDTDLEFRLDHLPRSLQYLCITSYSFKFNLGEFVRSDPLDLPCLKSVLFGGIMPPSALLFQMKLRKDHIMQALIRDHNMHYGYHYPGVVGAAHKEEGVLKALDGFSPPPLYGQDDSSINEAVDLFYERAKKRTHSPRVELPPLPPSPPPSLKAKKKAKSSKK